MYWKSQKRQLQYLAKYDSPLHYYDEIPFLIDNCKLVSVCYVYLL